jgi:hypothetical protein
MMRLGIIGLPLSGKTTLFNALTGSDLPVGAFAGPGAKLEIHSATVDIPDARLDGLSEAFQPRKTTFAKVSYTDVGGLQRDAARGGLPGRLTNHLEQMDGFLHVLRAFDDPSHPHPEGSIDPARDVKLLQDELLLHDMVTVERRLERLAEERQKGGRDPAEVEREADLFRECSTVLERGEPLRRDPGIRGKVARLRGFGLLTVKPELIIVNAQEGSEASYPSLPETKPALMMCAKLEMEIAQLPSEEADEYLQEYGIEESGRERVLRASYGMLELQSFFTINEQEARAWTLPKGGTAYDAAGTIHSDMARGFIRAEVIDWDELLALGGVAEARAQGRLRIEGKDYPVQDGEVVYIRFNV